MAIDENVSGTNNQSETSVDTLSLKTDIQEDKEQKQITIEINIRTTIKIAIIVAVAIVVGVSAYLFKDFFVAAMVNGEPISRLAVISELEKVSGKNALEALITRKLIEDEARKKGITVSDDEVDAELKKIDDNLKLQGQTLALVLKSKNMTQADLEKQLFEQKTVEKLVIDKIAVTDNEVEQYIKNKKITVSEDQEAQFNEQIKEQLRRQKLNEAADALIDSLHSTAKIRYFVNY